MDPTLGERSPRSVGAFHDVFSERGVLERNDVGVRDL